jgi:hypothetical protein
MPDQPAHRGGLLILDRARCFGAAPLTAINYLHQSIRKQDWLSIHRNHKSGAARADYPDLCLIRHSDAAVARPITTLTIVAGVVCSAAHIADHALRDHRRARQVEATARRPAAIQTPCNGGTTSLAVTAPLPRSGPDPDDIARRVASSAAVDGCWLSGAGGAWISGGSGRLSS